VVKPAAPAIMATGVYGGTTLPDNGRPMLLINPAGVAQVAGVRAYADAISTRPVAEEVRVEAIPTLLFRGLDDAVRAIRLGLVQRIEDVPVDTVSRAGGRLTLAHDGRILPLFGCEEAPVMGNRLRVLLLGDGINELAYAIGAVIDIHDLSPTIEAAAEPGAIAGVLLVDGRQVELLDPYWLFAQCGSAPQGGARPLCLLDGRDPWMRDVLRPIVEQAGYRVDFIGASTATPESAVAILAMAQSGAQPGDETAYPASAPVIRLRASEDDEAEPKGSIYRYDRGGLIAALTAAQQRQPTRG
jgi:two-component system chemotaxis sensor kinase CheA